MMYERKTKIYQRMQDSFKWRWCTICWMQTMRGHWMRFGSDVWMTGHAHGIWHIIALSPRKPSSYVAEWLLISDIQTCLSDCLVWRHLLHFYTQEDNCIHCKLRKLSHTIPICYLPESFDWWQTPRTWSTKVSWMSHWFCSVGRTELARVMLEKATGMSYASKSLRRQYNDKAFQVSNYGVQNRVKVSHYTNQVRWRGLVCLLGIRYSCLPMCPGSERLSCILHYDWYIR